MRQSTISLAVERARVSFLVHGVHADVQMDVSLPLDVPVAGVVPELLRLVRAADSTLTDDDGGRPAAHDVWLLRRPGGDAIAPEATLRSAGVADGDVLALRPERALVPPALHDDVVEAAARLNRAGIAGWGPHSAKWMAFVAVHLVAWAWTWLLLCAPFTRGATPSTALAALQALLLVAVAITANRVYQRSDVATAVGWASLPIVAALTWVTTIGLGIWGPPLACGVLAILAAVLCAAIGCGPWAHLVTGVGAALLALGGLAHAVGLPVSQSGVLLAVSSLLACRGVHRLPTGRLVARRAVGAGLGRAGADDVWERVRRVTATHSAVFAGLAVGAGVGALAVLGATQPLRWSGIAFALCCAAALGLWSRRPARLAERAALGVPATALTLATGSLVGRGGAANDLLTGMASAGLLLFTVALVVAGVVSRRLRGRLQRWLALADYVFTAAILPLAVWAVGGYSRLGLG